MGGALIQVLMWNCGGSTDSSLDVELWNCQVLMGGGALTQVLVWNCGGSTDSSLNVELLGEH